MNEIKINKEDISDISDEEIREIIQKITLKVIRTLTIEKNFEILKMMPSNKKNIAKALESTFSKI